MTSLTELEARYMNIIAYCQMNPLNGEAPESHHDVNTYVWADERAADLGISEKALGGVMSSLIQKGLIWTVTEDDPDDNGVGFTEAGFEAWLTQ